MLVPNISILPQSEVSCFQNDRNALEFVTW